jgi:hypothetical protein
MNVRELVEALPADANPEVLIHDLDTNYLVGIKTVEVIEGRVILHPVEYWEDDFPWGEPSRQLGGY